MAPQVTRREFLNTAAATTGTLTASRLSRACAAERPNVLFILADDLGYGDLSCYGRPDYKTPVLDPLAAQGMKFTSAYAAAPVCTPTRCALITGRYPQRSRWAYRSRSGRDRRRNWDSAGSSDGRVVAEGDRVRHGADRQVASGMGAGVRTEPPRLRRVLRHSQRRRRLLHAREGCRAVPDLWENLAPVERLGYMTDLLHRPRGANTSRGSDRSRSI